MKPITTPLLLALLAALLAGCGISIGGDDDEAAPTVAEEETATTEEETDPTETEEDSGGSETFEVDGFDITFQYPSDLTLTEDISFSESAGASAAESAAVAIDDSNLIGVQLFELGAEITDANFDQFKQSLDSAFSQIAGREISGRRIEVSGFQALEYELELTEPAGAVTRAVAIVDGSDEYLFNCQSLPEFRDRIEAACELALTTISPR